MSVEDSTYSPSEAARILKLSRRRVQQLLDSRELEGFKDTSGRWYAYQWSVHQLMSERPPRNNAPENSDSQPAAQETLERLEALQRELGRVEGRLELESVARSTLEEQLTRERERADQERAERVEMQTKADRLQEMLEEASKPWYRRWFS